MCVLVSAIILLTCKVESGGKFSGNYIKFAVNDSTIISHKQGIHLVVIHKKEIKHRIFRTNTEVYEGVRLFYFLKDSVKTGDKAVSYTHLTLPTKA